MGTSQGVSCMAPSGIVLINDACYLPELQACNLMEFLP